MRKVYEASCNLVDLLWSLINLKEASNNQPHIDDFPIDLQVY